MLASLALGTPVMNLIGAIGAALTLGARRAGVLLAVLVLPLYVPVLIFGVSAVDAAVFGFPARPHLLILGAMLAGALPLAAWAASAALAPGRCAVPPATPFDGGCVPQGEVGIAATHRCSRRFLLYSGPAMPINPGCLCIGLRTRPAL